MENKVKYVAEEKKKTLTELTGAYLNVLDLIDGADDNEDLKEEFKKILDGVGEEIEEKAERIAWTIRELEGKANHFDSLYKEFYSKSKMLKNSISNLKSYLEDSMVMVNKKKFKTDSFSFNIQENAPSLEIESEDNIPDEYYEIEKKLLKRELLNDIKKNGVEIEGVSLKQTESLRIR